MPKAKPPLLWLRFPDEAAACPACASPRIRLLDVIPIVRDAKGRRVSFITGCADCGLLFSNPPQTSEELDEYYSTGGPWAASHAERTKRIEARHARRLMRTKPPKPRTRPGTRDAMFDALEPYVSVRTPPAGARVLDFGCGDGSKFLDRLQEWGWQTYGIEPSTGVAFLRHQRLEAPPQDGSCDFVILHHVLEHIARPLDLLRQFAGALREGGVLFISVPRLETLPRHRDVHYCLNGRPHVVCFSETCLQSLLARAGFAVAGRLDERLDDLLTEGQPLRLRLVATRTSNPPPPPRQPLAPAVHALRTFGRADRGMARLTRVLPLRMRAALLDRGRETSRRRRHRER